jgi:DNA replication and repair protein RecF
MLIQTLGIRQFRNLTTDHYHFSPRFNLIFGQNGMGKTSLLEAIYLLALGRSFRTHSHEKLIRFASDSFELAAAFSTPDGTSPTLKLKRSRRSEAKISFGANTIAHVLEVTKTMPVQLITQESYQLLDDGPKARRNFLDQGLVYQDPAFLSVWRRFMQALKQRNAALKQDMSDDEILVWEQELAKTGDVIAHARQVYLDLLQPMLATILLEFDFAASVHLSLYSGWPSNEDLPRVLAKNRSFERIRGFTTQGPHRAELLIEHEPGHSVKDFLSRGQKKMLVYAMRLAQAQLLSERFALPSIYLIDEMPAELDAAHRAKILGLLSTHSAQIFMTGTDVKEITRGLPEKAQQMFHVEHGQLKTVASL